jgi:hypothetical protein
MADNYAKFFYYFTSGRVVCTGFGLTAFLGHGRPKRQKDKVVLALS